MYPTRLQKLTRAIRTHAIAAGLAAAAVMSVSAMPAQAGSLSDGEIIAIYNQVNSIDIETALLGEVKGHTESLRKLAKMVADDHTGVRKSAHELAVKIGVTPDLPGSRSDAAKDHYEVIARLRSLSGEAFDKAYLEHEIGFHAAAMEAVKTVLLPAAKSEELKAHFEQVLPHFQHHLSESIRVAKELGYRN